MAASLSARRERIGGMVTMEIRPGEGGADAEMFAGELAAAVAKHSGRSVQTVGKFYVLHRL